MRILMSFLNNLRTKGYLDPALVKNSVTPEEFQRLQDGEQVQIRLNNDLVILDPILEFPMDYSPEGRKTVAELLRAGIDRAKKLEERQDSVGKLMAAQVDYLQSAGWDPTPVAGKGVRFSNRDLAPHLLTLEEAVSLQKEQDAIRKHD